MVIQDQKQIVSDQFCVFPTSKWDSNDYILPGKAKQQEIFLPLSVSIKEKQNTDQRILFKI